MKIFVWDEHFITGLERIDEQHHFLIDLINRFGNSLVASKSMEDAELVSVFGQLADYAKYHFSTEESLMRECALEPRHIDMHARHHEDFLSQVTSMWRARTTMSNSVETLHGFLCAWLAFHVLGVDQDMARQIALIRAGKTSGEAFEIAQTPLDRSVDALLTALRKLYAVLTEKNQNLAQAYEQLLILGKLKDDYLAMISHEIRTPANGILGVGELLLDLCPASEDRTLYANLFEQSCLRLLNLINDATLIADMQKLTLKSGAAISFPNLLEEVRAALPDIRILNKPSTALNTVFLKGYPPLLKKALESLILLAASFSRDKQSAPMTATDEAGVLRVWLELDDLSLSDEQVVDFFKIESSVRAASAAESLGLAPVVAYQIITAFGGELRLLKGKGNHDYLEATFLKEKTVRENFMNRVH